MITNAKRFYKVTIVSIVAFIFIYVLTGRYYFQSYDEGAIKGTVKSGTNLYIYQPNLTNVTSAVEKRVKNIYFYNPQFFHVFSDWILDTWGTSKKFEKCAIPNCIVTRGNVSLEEIDAIIFKPRDMGYCPPTKPPGQVWIFAEFETPNYYYQSKCFHDLKSKVNWTMTYRRDADFPIAHGYFREMNKPLYSQKDLEDIFAKKTKTAVVFISHCPTVGKRLQFIKVLQSHGIQVDVFGSCGRSLKQCNNAARYQVSFNVSGQLGADCFSKVLLQYKFFLSLENSLCLDYTTEKSLHRVMQYPIIPVIRDGGNASMFHPPHSYLHTSDYSSVKELAQHMKLLAGNKTAYLEYLQWKQHYYTEDMYTEWNSAFCRICERLHNPESYRRVYRDIAAWHISPGGKHVCKGPTDLNS
ncbi:alpha-(1,3)-fucosyltransferase C-like [Pecten maximus]|uniref:alpha-(1,3)-fucosyltransferase C-like n=1 Tax=Pecten maximus TaxID=6579 RepID=UPI001458E66C|nr:alpha-(1,3)-fucosyltransferase C-like [Pecten maximus]